MKDIDIGSYRDLNEPSFDREVWRDTANQSKD